MLPVFPDNPMKKIVLIFCATVLLLVTARATSIVFNTFGPGDTYDLIAGNFVRPPIEFAAQFTAGASGDLATVDLGLTSLVIAGPVNAYLYGDASGSPDNSSFFFLGSGTPTGDWTSTDNSVVSFAVAGTVPVTTGTTYWLVLKAPIAGSQDHWNTSSPAISGNVDASIDDSTWVSASGFTPFLPAFRLTASSVSSVPDSGNTLVLLFGALATLLVLRSRLVRRLAITEATLEKRLG